MQLVVARAAEENDGVPLVATEIFSNPRPIVQLARDQVMSHQAGCRSTAERTNGSWIMGRHGQRGDVAIDRRAPRLRCPGIAGAAANGGAIGSLSDLSFHFGQSGERERAPGETFPGCGVQDALACCGQFRECIISLCTGKSQCGFTKEREAGDQLERIDLPAHERNEGVALAEDLILHGCNGSQVVPAKLRILEIGAGLIQAPQPIELSHTRMPQPAKLGKDIPNPVARFPAAAKFRKSGLDA